VLEATPVPDQDLRTFQNELRACTEGSLTGSEEDQYSEAKFLQVKSIIERFRGREGTTELDRRWTRKVTDVRNWFAFAASERWRRTTPSTSIIPIPEENRAVKKRNSHIRSSLQACLSVRSRMGSHTIPLVPLCSHRRGFGRGSDESAQYGLRLFENLNSSFSL